MRQVLIVPTNNGFRVEYKGFVTKEGEYSYKSVEGLTMLEEIGKELWGRKLEITEA